MPTLLLSLFSLPFLRFFLTSHRLGFRAYFVGPVFLLVIVPTFTNIIELLMPFEKKFAVENIKISRLMKAVVCTECSENVIRSFSLHIGYMSTFSK